MSELGGEVGNSRCVTVLLSRGSGHDRPLPAPHTPQPRPSWSLEATFLSSFPLDFSAGALPALQHWWGWGGGWGGDPGLVWMVGRFQDHQNLFMGR